MQLKQIQDNLRRIPNLSVLASEDMDVVTAPLVGLPEGVLESTNAILVNLLMQSNTLKFVKVVNFAIIFRYLKYTTKPNDVDKTTFFFPLLNPQILKMFEENALSVLRLLLKKRGEQGEATRDEDGFSPQYSFVYACKLLAEKQTNAYTEILPVLQKGAFLNISLSNPPSWVSLNLLTPSWFQEQDESNIQSLISRLPTKLISPDGILHCLKYFDYKSVNESVVANLTTLIDKLVSTRDSKYDWQTLEKGYFLGRTIEESIAKIAQDVEAINQHSVVDPKVDPDVERRRIQSLLMDFSPVDDRFKQSNFAQLIRMTPKLISPEGNKLYRRILGLKYQFDEKYARALNAILEKPQLNFLGDLESLADIWLSQKGLEKLNQFRELFLSTNGFKFISKLDVDISEEDIGLINSLNFEILVKNIGPNSKETVHTSTMSRVTRIAVIQEVLIELNNAEKVVKPQITPKTANAIYLLNEENECVLTHRPFISQNTDKEPLLHLENPEEQLTFEKLNEAFYLIEKSKTELIPICKPTIDLYLGKKDKLNQPIKFNHPYLEVENEAKKLEPKKLEVSDVQKLTEENFDLQYCKEHFSVKPSGIEVFNRFLSSPLIELDMPISLLDKNILLKLDIRYFESSEMYLYLLRYAKNRLTETDIIVLNESAEALLNKFKKHEKIFEILKGLPDKYFDQDSFPPKLIILIDDKWFSNPAYFALFAKWPELITPDFIKGNMNMLERTIVENPESLIHAYQTCDPEIIQTVYQPHLLTHIARHFGDPKFEDLITAAAPHFNKESCERLDPTEKKYQEMLVRLYQLACAEKQKRNPEKGIGSNPVLELLRLKLRKLLAPKKTFPLFRNFEKKYSALVTVLKRDLVAFETNFNRDATGKLTTSWRASEQELIGFLALKKASENDRAPYSEIYKAIQEGQTLEISRGFGRFGKGLKQTSEDYNTTYTEVFDFYFKPLLEALKRDKNKDLLTTCLLDDQFYELLAGESAQELLAIVNVSPHTFMKVMEQYRPNELETLLQRKDPSFVTLHTEYTTNALSPTPSSITPVPSTVGITGASTPPLGNTEPKEDQVLGVDSTKASPVPSTLAVIPTPAEISVTTSAATRKIIKKPTRIESEQHQSSTLTEPTPEKLPAGKERVISTPETAPEKASPKEELMIEPIELNKSKTKKVKQEQREVLFAPVNSSNGLESRSGKLFSSTFAEPGFVFIPPEELNYQLQDSDLLVIREYLSVKAEFGKKEATVSTQVADNPLEATLPPAKISEDLVFMPSYRLDAIVVTKEGKQTLPAMDAINLYTTLNPGKICYGIMNIDGLHYVSVFVYTEKETAKTHIRFLDPAEQDDIKLTTVDKIKSLFRRGFPQAEIYDSPPLTQQLNSSDCGYCCAQNGEDLIEKNIVTFEQGKLVFHPELLTLKFDGASRAKFNSEALKNRKKWEENLKQAAKKQLPTIDPDKNEIRMEDGGDYSFKINKEIDVTKSHADSFLNQFIGYFLQKYASEVNKIVTEAKCIPLDGDEAVVSLITQVLKKNDHQINIFNDLVSYLREASKKHPGALIDYDQKTIRSRMIGYIQSCYLNQLKEEFWDFIAKGKDIVTVPPKLEESYRNYLKPLSDDGEGIKVLENYYAEVKRFVEDNVERNVVNQINRSFLEYLNDNKISLESVPDNLSKLYDEYLLVKVNIAKWVKDYNAKNHRSPNEHYLVVSQFIAQKVKEEVKNSIRRNTRPKKMEFSHSLQNGTVTPKGQPITEVNKLGSFLDNKRDRPSLLTEESGKIPAPVAVSTGGATSTTIVRRLKAPSVAGPSLESSKRVNIKPQEKKEEKKEESKVKATPPPPLAVQPKEAPLAIMVMQQAPVVPSASPSTNSSNAATRPNIVDKNDKTSQALLTLLDNLNAIDLPKGGFSAFFSSLPKQVTELKISCKKWLKWFKSTPTAEEKKNQLKYMAETLFRKFEDNKVLADSLRVPIALLLGISEKYIQDCNVPTEIKMSGFDDNGAPVEKIDKGYVFLDTRIRKELNSFLGAGSLVRLQDLAKDERLEEEGVGQGLGH